MRASPTCPALVPGRPFLQLDFARARWATEQLSPSGLRAWLRLLTHFRNDRPIPSLSTRRLAQIAGISQPTACKVLVELRGLVAFCGDRSDGAGEDGLQDRQQDIGTGEDRSGVAPAPDADQSLITPRSSADRQRSTPDRRRSTVDHSSLFCKQANQEGNTLPPSSCGAASPLHHEEDRRPGGSLPGDSPLAPPSALSPGGVARAIGGQDLAIDPRLDGVSAELLAYWAGKPGQRTPLAFTALQGELCRIVCHASGGLEAVREQLSVASQKGWGVIRYSTWLAWRQANPEPIALTEEELCSGGLFPELNAFERRFKATYGPQVSGHEVLRAYTNYTQRRQREQAAPDLPSAA